MTRNKEKAYVTTLIEEIREKLALDLEPSQSRKDNGAPVQA
jgi:hypothetical protein